MENEPIHKIYKTYEKLQHQERYSTELTDGRTHIQATRDSGAIEKGCQSKTFKNVWYV